MSILVVGAGLSGLTIAERYSSIGHEVLVIEKRNHIGGNCADFVTEKGQMVAGYGPHTFHTNDDEVWRYVNDFASWRSFEYKAKSLVDGKFVPIPVNINTVNEIFRTRIRTEYEMLAWLKENVQPVHKPRNSEESAIGRVGKVLYEKMFKNYTRKQWDVLPVELDSSVLSRIPVRISFDDRYFTDKYQALPNGGYTAFLSRIIDASKIQVKLNTEWINYRHNESKFSKVFFTGPIDSYFDRHFGTLQYRSVNFQLEEVQSEIAQSVPALHFPSTEDYTRIVDYKHFYPGPPNSTVISKEFPTWEGEPYYPVPTKRNAEIYDLYQEIALESERKSLYFVGRLANYKYFNMDQAIRNALDLFYRLEY